MLAVKLNVAGKVFKKKHPLPLFQILTINTQKMHFYLYFIEGEKDKSLILEASNNKQLQDRIGVAGFIICKQPKLFSW